MMERLVFCKNSSKRVTSLPYFGSMGDTCKGSKNFRICKGVQNTLSKKPITGDSCSDGTHGSGTSKSNTGGDREHVEERSHRANRGSGWGIFKQYFLGWEKWWRKLTCGELKILKQVHSISEFQNGRVFLPPRITARGRLHLQAGYERCLFFSSTASVIKELCSFFIFRESLRLALLMFHLETSSQNLQKIAENANASTEGDKCFDNNIFGRYAYNGSNNERNSHVQKNCNLPPVAFRFCFKSGEVHFESSSGNIFFWCNNMFFEDVCLYHRRC